MSPTSLGTSGTIKTIARRALKSSSKNVSWSQEPCSVVQATDSRVGCFETTNESTKFKVYKERKEQMR